MPSPSSRRAWIEIQPWGVNTGVAPVALLAEGVDRNVPCGGIGKLPFVSPSSRRAWIEICPLFYLGIITLVALLAEGVDRNVFRTFWNCEPVNVALLAEGVDRNHTMGST